MDIWSDKDEAFFKVPWQNPVCLNSSSVFFSIETSAKLTAKRMQNASSIAISSSLFSLHKPLCDPLMSFSRRYPVCTQALPWWLPGHNGNDVFSSFGASKKKTRWKIFQRLLELVETAMFFLAKVGGPKFFRLKRRTLRIVEIFCCFGCTTPMKKWKKLPTSTGWILFISIVSNPRPGYNSSKKDSNRSTSKTLRTQVPDFICEGHLWNLY